MKRYQKFILLLIIIVVVVGGLWLWWSNLSMLEQMTVLRIETPTCEELPTLSIRDEPGPGFPGVSGAPRFGIADGTQGEILVRRSWSSLSDEEKQQFVDGWLLMKTTLVGSDMLGAERADYASLCNTGQTYERSLLDYYVELHISANATMGGSPMTMMAHRAPHFLPWHRYVLLRFEADMRTVLDDPTFTLPYWDWDDCEDGTGDGSNPCPAIFDEAFLGSHGGPQTDNEVTGYMVDAGYEVNVWTDGDISHIFNADSVVCGARPFKRSAGMDDFNLESFVYSVPSSTETLATAMEIPSYDVEPFDDCQTDETQSFRQFIEGFRANEPFPCYVDGRCGPHGMGHVYVGGEMTNGGTPNDPLFFLHHANVDRIWAMWQQNNLDTGNITDYGNPGFPEMWRVSIFNFPDVMVDEMFDFRTLGYTYDSIVE